MTAGRAVIVAVLAVIAFAATFLLLPSSDAESGAAQAPRVLPLPAAAIEYTAPAGAGALPSLARRPRPPRQPRPPAPPPGSARPPAAPPVAPPVGPPPPVAPQPPPPTIIEG